MKLTLGRSLAIVPETLFRIIIYGNIERIYLSRDLGKTCRRNINFKWPLQEQKTPKYNILLDLKVNSIDTKSVNTVLFFL